MLSVAGLGGDEGRGVMRRSILILLLLLFATPALAVDGVLEINQTCAVQTGCFAGDTAGERMTKKSTAEHCEAMVSCPELA
jgi:hypothetical protein